MTVNPSDLAPVTKRAPRERPIGFTSESVRAIQAGSKRQTRRVMRPQPVLSPNGLWWHWPTLAGVAHWTVGETRPAPDESAAERMFQACPYGVPGDRLWVKEVWLENALGELVYRADLEGVETSGRVPSGGNWKSQRFMPRRVARLLLEVTSVRVEPVMDIRPDECVLEGLDDPCGYYCDESVGHVDHYGTILAFEKVWDAINGKRPGCRFRENPWVWVVSFRLLSPSEV